MDAAYLSALSALAGSAIGAASSFATTWLTQRYNHRLDRSEKDRARRESIYGAFIDEASSLYADAVQHEMKDVTQLVKLHSLLSRMRLFASPDIVEQAEDLMEKLIDAYEAPNQSFHDIQSGRLRDLDPLRQFSEQCRKELSRY